MHTEPRSVSAGLIACGIALGLDQITKVIVVANASTFSGSVPLFTGISLVYVQNDGVSFGIFGGTAPGLLIALSIAVSLWLLAMMIQTRNQIEAAGYGMILGGALGNVIDRVRYGAVTDFIDLYVGTWHWPAFNLADTSIFCGVALFISAAYLENRST